MTIKPQSFFSDLISKSKRLDERQKRLRLREKRLIQSAERRRVTVSDFFGESGQSQAHIMGGDPSKILKELKNSAKNLNLNLRKVPCVFLIQ